MRRPRAMGVVVAALIATTTRAETTPTASFGDTWSLPAIVEAPKILQTAISRDGSTAVYVVRHDRLSENRRVSDLIEVDVATGQRRTLLASPWIGRIAQLDAGQGWAVLADRGEGVQLYRLTPDGRWLDLARRDNLVTIGTDTSVSVSETADDADQRFGILDYGLAPDRRSFWYTTARRTPNPGSSVAVVDAPFVPYAVFQANVSELHVVDGAGRDRLVASAAGGAFPLPWVIFDTDAATWDAAGPDGVVHGLSYLAPAPSVDGERHLQSLHFDLDRAISETAGQAPSVADRALGPKAGLQGPRGGVLSIEGELGKQRLVERTDKDTVDYGPLDGSLNSYWSPGDWTFPDAKVVVVTARYSIGRVRNVLVKLTQDGRRLEIPTDGSLDHCAFSDGAGTGVCIRDGISVPPTLVKVDVRSWTMTDLARVDPRYDGLRPLQVEARTWSSGTLQTGGFVVYPRGYRAGQTYPMIIITHGNDTDDTFVSREFQWSYPAQVFAEQGYFVVYINDIPLSQSAERLQAYRQWASRTGKLSGDRLVQIIWLDQLSLYKVAIDELVTRGMVDSTRVGIAGYSRGSQMVTMAVSQTDMFRAASSGDGDYLNPSTYWSPSRPLFDMLFGGSPYDATARDNWQRYAPAFRANATGAAVLFQVADDYFDTGKVEYYHALRAAKRPTEFVLFSRETHLFHVPANRLAAMQQTLDWFNFWLKDAEDPDPAKADQYRRWRALRPLLPPLAPR